MWGGGDDDEEDGRCGAGEVWDPELGGCVTPIELPPIIVDPPPGGSPPPDPEPDPDPWPWPDPDPEDPGGGGGGDHGGGGTPPEPPDPTEDCEAGQECEDDDDISWDEFCNRFHEPGCEWRHPSTWSQGEHAGVQAAIDVIRGNGCGVEANLLESAVNSGFLQLFDARVTRYGPPLEGRVDPVTGIILMWTGYNAELGDSVNWTKTLAHEALHKHLGVTNHPPGFRERVAECSA